MHRRLIVPALVAAVAGTAVAAPASAIPEPAPIAPPPYCELRQAVVADTPSTVVQAMMLINSSGTVFEDWELGFELPADASVRAISRMVWEQDGTSVTAQGRGSAATLAPGEAITLFFVTDSDAAGAPLADVRVDGELCEAPGA